MADYLINGPFGSNDLLDLMKSSEVRTAGDRFHCGRVKCFLKITEKVFIWQVKNDAGGWLCHDFFKARVKKTTTTIVLHSIYISIHIG